MLSNKFLALSLGALLLSSTATFAAKTGAETGGGGDAVTINGKMVIRDLLVHGNMTAVENNIEFLKDIPGFKRLIESIAKVHPDFASEIVLDLSKVKFYLSSSELPLLSSSQTTMADSKIYADTQLAIRTGSDIEVSPKFFENDYTAYLLVHESLHGLLRNNAGPAHHQRVRNIVNYLYTNRNNLTAQGLDAVLTKNNYSVYSPKAKEVWDKNLDSTVRCSFALSNIQLAQVGLFEELDCGSDALERAAAERDYLQASKDRDALVEEKFPGLTKIHRPSYPQSRLIKELIPSVSLLPIGKDGLFQSKIKYAQKAVCNENKITKKELLELQSLAQTRLEEIEKVNNSLDAASLPATTKEKFVKSFDLLSAYNNGKGIAELKKETNEISDLIANRLSRAQQNEIKCNSL